MYKLYLTSQVGELSLIFGIGEFAIRINFFEIDLDANINNNSSF
jgi:hypothetical protein